MKLTGREEVVLGGVMRSLANKEIAASLNLSERTVKFHVSSLLMKFRVRGRMELAEANRRIPASVTGPQSFASREARDYAAAPASYHRAPHVTEGSKNPFPNFGTLQGNAIQSSDPNSHFSGDSLRSFCASMRTGSLQSDAVFLETLPVRPFLSKRPVAARAVSR